MRDRDPDDLRIAFFLTSYGPGDQLMRLVRLLRQAEPDAPIVVHHDTFASTFDTRRLDEVPGVHLLTPTEPIVWGDMTLEAARWRVFRWILENLDVDWVTLLSEQDYPVASMRELRERLATSGVDAFVEGSPIDEIADPVLRAECVLRYRYQYVSLPRTPLRNQVPARVRSRYLWARGYAITAVTRLQRTVFLYTTPEVLDLPTRIGLRSDARSPFGPDFRCWYNDCWITLSRRALEHVVDHVDEHPDFVRYYSRTVIPLESATATILFNDPGLVVANQSLHAIRWSDAASGRPDVFTLDDLDHLRRSGAIFARKFGTDDTAVLDALDRVVVGQHQEQP